MAKKVFTNAQIKLGGLDISDHCSQVAIDEDQDRLEATAFGDGYKQFVLGFKSWEASAEVFQNFATIDKHIQAIRHSTVPSAALSVLPEKGVSKSDANPEYSGTVQITKYQPINIAVGQVPKFTLNMVGTGALDTATS